MMTTAEVSDLLYPPQMESPLMTPVERARRDVHRRRQARARLASWGVRPVDDRRPALWLETAVLAAVADAPGKGRWRNTPV